MDYATLDRLLQGRCKNRRKLGNNTYAIRRTVDKELAIVLHGTPVLIFLPCGDVHVWTRGWRTVTTKNRINQYIPGQSLYQQDYQWYWDCGIPFMDWDFKDKDGVIYRQNGKRAR